MDLSIVIVNWNTCTLLRDCLSSVFRGLGDLNAEVLVVDNASKDGSVRMLAAQFPHVILIQNTENLGFAAGNNTALQRSRGRYVLLLNTDTVVHKLVLTEAVAWLNTHPEVGILGPRVLNADGSIQASCSSFPSLGFLALQTLGITHVPRWDSYRMTGWDRACERKVQVISGAAMFVRGSAMKDVGNLDETFFFYGEETDWCRRFANAGWDLVFAPIPDITHFGGGSIGKLNHHRDVLLTQATIRLHRKHSGFGAAAVCFALLGAHNISRAVLWSVLTLVKGQKARDRALHFWRVVANFSHVWPGTAATGVKS